MIHLCVEWGLTKKSTHMEQDNMHNSLSPLRRDMLQKRLRETDFSDLQGRWASISSRHPRRQEEERAQAEQPSLPKVGMYSPALPGYPHTCQRKGSMVIRHHVPLAVRWAACHKLAGHSYHLFKSSQPPHEPRTVIPVSM